jgi:hypothetical protein
MQINKYLALFACAIVVYAAALPSDVLSEDNVPESFAELVQEAVAPAATKKATPKKAKKKVTPTKVSAHDGDMAQTGWGRRRRTKTIRYSGMGEIGFMNMGHMLNTKETLDWALKKGANTVEIDIVFNGANSKVSHVRHSQNWEEPCDCTCYVPSAPFLSWGNNVCSVLMSSGGKGSGAFACQAARPIRKYMKWLAERKNRISMVYFDNKVNAGWTTDQQKTAGKSIAQEIVFLFKAGYRGSIIVGGSDASFKTFLMSSITHIKDTSEKMFERSYFSYDFHGAKRIISIPLSQESKQTNRNIVEENIEHMHRDFGHLTTNFIYSVGISACAPTTHYDMIHHAVHLKNKNEKGRTVKAVIVWTIDSKSAMKKYIEMKVDGMMTNYPSYVKHEAIQLGVKHMNLHH